MKQTYLARHPIMNVNGKIIGYELLFRNSTSNGEANIICDLTATSQVLMNVLTYINPKKILDDEDQQAFINIEDKTLRSGILDILDPKIFILEILEHTKIDVDIINIIRRLHKKEFTFALDDFDCTESTIKKFQQIYKYINIIKVDVQNLNEKNLKKLIPSFKKRNIKLIAEKIESKEQYKKYISLGFDYFQGYYFKKPEEIKEEVVEETGYSTILYTINMLKEEKPIDEIETYIKTNPNLVYDILRYLNSPNIGLKQEVTSIKHALNLIGRSKLLKWLLMYIYAEVKDNKLNNELLEKALTRAKKLEEKSEDKDKDKAFLTGMFSLMDVLFGVEFDHIFDMVKLDSNIQNAIKTKEGSLGNLLKIVEIEEKDKLRELINYNFDKFNIKDIIILLQTIGIKL